MDTEIFQWNENANIAKVSKVNLNCYNKIILPTGY